MNREQSSRVTYGHSGGSVMVLPTAGIGAQQTFGRDFFNDRFAPIVLKKSVFDGWRERYWRAEMTADAGFPAHMAGIGAGGGTSMASLRRF